MTKHIIALTLLLNVALFARLAAGQCLEYEPTIVTLTGTVVRETHPGPPHFEDVSKGDRPETIWVLRLDTPICMRAGDELNVPENEIKEIQLVLTSEQYEQYRHFVGSRVKATGSLYHSNTGHHHKSLLLKTREILRTHNTASNPDLQERRAG